MNRKQEGFTLMEIMIVVVVVGLLTTLMLPAYQKYTDRARRGDGITALLDASLKQEKYRADSVTYAGTLSSIPVAATSAEGYYNLSIVGTPTGSSYLMTAAPTGIQSGDDCGTFAIDQNGPNHTGSYADADCWRR